jgi:PAS domain-containing protein
VQEGSGERVTISGVHNDPFSHLRIVSAVVVAKDATLVIDFRIEQYQKEIMQEFINENYKIAVFDGSDYPVYWPFDKEKLDGFKKGQSRFYDQRENYNVVVSSAGQTPWQLYFFFKENNFETFRTITILFLVFALYCCFYQLLVELLGVNSAKTYFENIDFAIFNQINEGVILTNNAGRVVFANNAAHEIFSDRKSSLLNIQLKEILGNIEDTPDGGEKPRTLTVKMSDKFLETIHSPIVKKGKKLGSLTVIRLNVKEERTFRIALNKLMEIIPEGAVFVDKNHEVAAANLMAKCYLGNLDRGAGIDVVDPVLADFIYENIGSGPVKRMEISDGLLCEIAPVYDDDGVYAGTLVLLLINNTSDKDPA